MEQLTREFVVNLIFKHAILITTLIGFSTIIMVLFCHRKKGE